MADSEQDLSATFRVQDNKSRSTQPAQEQTGSVKEQLTNREEEQLVAKEADKQKI